jgi:hypothetical protein
MSNTANEANEANAEFTEALAAFAEKHGYALVSDRVRAKDPSQGQGFVSSNPSDDFHGYVLNRLSGY